MQRLYILFITTCILFTHTVFANDQEAHDYKTWKTIENVEFYLKNFNGFTQPKAAITCTDGTKWNYTGDTMHLEAIRLWQKGDILSVHAFIFNNHPFFILKNTNYRFDLDIKVHFDISTKSALPTITQKIVLNDSEQIHLSNGSIWKVKKENLLWWKKPVSNAWKVGDHILITGRFYRGYGMTNFDNADRKNSTRSVVCMKIEEGSELHTKQVQSIPNCQEILEHKKAK